MNIRADELERIAIDRFLSTSGKWLSILAERYEPGPLGLRGWYLVICHAETRRVRLIKRIAIDNPTLAYLKWEEWRSQFTAKPEYTEETEIPTGLSEPRLSLPVLTEEDHALMLKMKPRGARIFIREITPVDEVTARAAEVGLHVVVAEENKPRPTMGIVVAVGEDPLAQELYKPGLVVMFSRYAGNQFIEAGQTYRSLDLHEIIGCRDPADGIDDLQLDRKDIAS